MVQACIGGTRGISHWPATVGSLPEVGAEAGPTLCGAGRPEARGRRGSVTRLMLADGAAPLLGERLVLQSASFCGIIRLRGLLFDSNAWRLVVKPTLLKHAAFAVNDSQPRFLTAFGARTNSAKFLAKQADLCGVNLDNRRVDDNVCLCIWTSLLGDKASAKLRTGRAVARAERLAG